MALSTCSQPPGKAVDKVPPRNKVSRIEARVREGSKSSHSAVFAVPRNFWGPFRLQKMRSTKKKLNTKLEPKQELFCQLYARDRECFGNATKSYSVAYALADEQRDSAERSGSRLLRNVEVRSRVDALLDEQIDQRVVDRELITIILQNMDLSAKVSAIREFNRVRGRGAARLEGEFIFKWMGDDE